MVSFTKTSKAFKEYNPEEAWRLLNHDLIGYDTATSKYLELHRLAKKDFTRNVPSQRIETFPVSGNRGLYGWTLLPTDGKIRRREDLYGTIEGLITDVHENIHTPDERETRYLVDQLLEPLLDFLMRENNKYPQKRGYQKHLPPNYET